MYLVRNEGRGDILTLPGQTRNLRFIPDHPTLLISKGDHALLWRPGEGIIESHEEASKDMIEAVLTRHGILAMTENDDGTLRKVNQSSRGYEATFQGMSRDQADLACRRLKARNVTCFMIGPS